MTATTTASPRVVPGTTRELPPLVDLAGIRERHELLLKRVDDAVGADSSQPAELQATRRLGPEIAAFLEQGAAAGAFMDDVQDRTASQILLDYWKFALERADLATPPSRLVAFDPDVQPDLPDTPAPYVGLEAFRSAENFHGREEDTHAILAKLRRSQLLVVHGASGSGKSSLIMGGVLPCLSDASLDTPLRTLRPFTPGEAPLVSLASVLLPEGAGADELAGAAAGLRSSPDRVADLVPPAGTVVVTIDQFEEVFTLAPEQERTALATVLASLLSARPSSRVLLTIREEFHAKMSTLEPLAPWLTADAWYEMRPLVYGELVAAVERPAQKVGLIFQKGIIENLVRAVLGQDAALPLLQFTLQELWRRRQHNRVSWSTYESVGDPTRALDLKATQFFRGLVPESQVEVRRILMELIHVDELLEPYRRPLRLSALVPPGNERAERMLRLLTENDFVRRLPGDLVEIKHEALLRNWSLMEGWVREKRTVQQRLLALKQAAERWEAAGGPEEGLLTGWQLREALDLTDLQPLERRYVQESSAAQARATRRREMELEAQRADAEARALREHALHQRTKRLAIAAAVLAAACLVAFDVAWKKSGQAERASAAEKAKTFEATLQSKLAEEARMVAVQEGAAVREANRKLTSAFSRAVAKAVGSGTSPGSPPEIHLYVSAEDQIAPAKDIATQLQLGGVSVGDGPILQTGRSAAASEVRYFTSADRGTAENIASLIGDFLVAEDMHIEATSHPMAPGRKPHTFDVLFAPGTLGSTSVPKATEPEASYYVVLGNESSCDMALASLVYTAFALGRQGDIRPQDFSLRLMQASLGGRPVFVVALGGALRADQAAELVRAIRHRPGIRPDVYTSLGPTFAYQTDCDWRRYSLDRLLSLAGKYTAGLAKGVPQASLERVATEMVTTAWAGQLSPDAIREASAGDDSPGVRLAVLSAIQADPMDGQLATALASLQPRAPGTAFEQRWALEALWEMLPLLSKEQKGLLARALEDAWNQDFSHLRQDPIRRKRLEDLLRALDHAPPRH